MKLLFRINIIHVVHHPDIIVHHFDQSFNLVHHIVPVAVVHTFVVNIL
jgi:hypothetical protein